MNLDRIGKACDQSEAWQMITNRYNQYVDECNKTGHKISQQERDTLNEMRILMTALMDKNVMNTFAEETYNHINGQEAM